MLKDKLYNYFVKKNGRVWYEYERYVREHMEDHRLHRFRHLKILFKLNWFYRVRKQTTPYLYWDVPLNPDARHSEANKQTDKKAVKTEQNSLPRKPQANKKEIKKSDNKKKSNIKLPFVGSESSRLNRLKPQFLVKRAMLYDIVSFDIFDTLLLRNVSDPKKVFLFLEYETGIAGFADLRIKTEQRLRAECQKTEGHREISIVDIYKELEKETGIDYEYGINKELEVEEKLIVVNPYMKFVYDMLRENGHKIIYTSDFYYPKEYVAKLLEDKGYTVDDNLYVSCDYKKSKIDKQLYLEIQKDYPEQTIYHIGDNVRSDVKCAEEMGIKPFYYANVNKAGEIYRADGMSEVIGSAYSAIVNNYLYNGLYQKSPAFEYGFIYGGIYVFGFCNYIYKLAVREDVDKVIFLARDGAIYQRVFEYLFPYIKTSYLYWSREIGTKYCLEEDRHSFLNRMIRYRCNNTKKYTIQNLVEEIDVPEYREAILAVFDEQDLMTEDNADEIIRLTIEHIEIIEDTYRNKYRWVDKYLNNQIRDSESILLVDVGWNGSGPLQLAKIFQKKNPDLKVKNVIAASLPSNVGQSDISILSENLYAYLFSNSMNRNMQDVHKSARRNDFFFEMFTQNTEPSFSGILNDGQLKMDFQFPEIENYELIKEIHDGIFEFSKLWKNYFKEYDFMYNISGYDAYCPFRLVRRDVNYFKKNFPNYILSRVVGLHNENEIETLQEYLK